MELVRSSQGSFETIAKCFEKMGNAHLKMGDKKSALKNYQTAQTESHSNSLELKINKLRKSIKKQEAKDYIDPEKVSHISHISISI